MQAEQVDQLHMLLQTQLALTDQLTHQLHQERELLAQNHIDALEEIISTKADVLVQIAKTEQQVNEMLFANGYSDIRVPGIINTLDEPMRTDMSTLWQHLRHAVQNCMTQNQINNQIVTGCMQQTQQSLKILSQQPADVTLYGASGKALEPRTRTHISI